ncbi:MULTISPECIES: hypothetical protein [unclassified Herbaspirillum]|uniref:hypothetical protein n=1 Tax=unclassified Herbaspirillum TaxID=2624150 RepID=UPI000C08E30D|nr:MULTISPECIES: hypothetical protein [unclassified Herbaspirillum]MAF01201.1 hypothetical protein [Herbaspirillum sp.]MBO15299.1 hypothetical protein [Herbaspirillum sp.]|tara:strand:- start:1816 stop:2169 length:354 start_codon:yes stop_codon:yes gene_type:complete
MPAPLPARTTTQVLPLATGQHLQLWLPAGSQLLCQAPQVRVTESAQWQADRLVSRQTRLSDGERMVLAHEGWIGVLATHEGELLCLRPVAQAWYAPLVALLRSLLGARTAAECGSGR